MGVAVFFVRWKVFPTTRALQRSGRMHIPGCRLCLTFLSTRAMHMAGKERLEKEHVWS